MTGEEIALGAKVLNETINETLKTGKEVFPHTVNVADIVIAEQVGKMSSGAKIKQAEQELELIEKGSKLAKENMPRTCDSVDESVAAIIKSIKRWIEKEISKPHGSKVKNGKYRGCRILYAGTKSCIVIDKDKLLYLIPENVKSCYFVEKKFKFHKMDNDYYYEITFIDGAESYIRVSRRNRRNMDSLADQLGFLGKRYV